MGETVAYIRVSSKDQNIDRQRDKILPLVTSERSVFIDKESGKDFDRPGYNAMKNYIRPGDTLLIKSLDRLGRNFSQIRKEWQELTEKGIFIRVLDFPALNTSEYEENDLTRKFISCIILDILSYVAENERDNIRQRQREGIDAALKRGVHFGRKIVKPDRFDEVAAKWQAGEITATAAMKELGMAKTTFYKRLKEAGIKKTV